MKLTPKEKAKQLVDRFVGITLTDFSDENFEQTKACALICLDELLDAVPLINNTLAETKKRMYYMDVRAEIQKL